MKQEKFVVKLPFELWNLLSLRMILKNESSELYIFIFNVLFKKKKKKKRKIENGNFRKNVQILCFIIYLN